ncbi:fatty acid cis/trans isomerase [Alcanivorax sp. DP30]|uniref:fatty acid cis/trans isomerase n=1 Tax=Alcanivorax sp. DP30 TaxID=2606217 RepID=UPI00136FE213|nr:fatty acid cis/trans isomerase [Alcanivorax sp. DP30]MZR64092.1 peptidylprolyl isomerase [Alcanivorax sp. DP30]
MSLARKLGGLAAGVFGLCTVALAATPDYQKDIRPIFDQKCLACHGCYDAPCQLKMENLDGLDRGASKLPVYNGGREDNANPTRLGVDAQNTSQWRDKGFYSVVESAYGMQGSLLYRMLKLGHSHQFPSNEKLPKDIQLGINRENTCPNPEEFDDYADDHPLEGMPLAVTGLTDQEFDTLSRWMQDGAPREPEPLSLSAAEREQIQAWEAMLNASGKREALVARWLFEHLYLAHLYFGEEDGSAPDHFFKLVRSSTPPGEPMAPVPTVRPNDAPPENFWYRLAPVTGTLVHKTHITFALNPEKLARTRDLFFSDSWQVESLPGYEYADQANPFLTFAAIPAKARYQFMLDNAEYFVRTFIRGPVCRGQIATDVIRDQFWAVFQDPQQDLYITNADYRQQVSPLLGLPGQNVDLLKMGAEWIKYSENRNSYLKARQAAYREYEPKGPGWESLWDGDGHNRNALLTIFRNHDNASVRKGLLGDYPLTTWVMDYPLFERTYYNLVVNFNVFGSVTHQAQTRLYFDLIRNGAEQNTLRYFPAELRTPVLNHWYQDGGKLKLKLSYARIDTSHPTGIPYQTSTPVNEFNANLVQRFASINARPDPLNRCDGEQCHRKQVSAWQQQADIVLSQLASRRAGNLKAIDYLPEVSMIRVENENGEQEIYTLFRNRAHSNVAFMFNEDMRFQPELDTLTLYPGVLSSYPNFMFNIEQGALADFVRQMNAVEDEESFTRVVDQYGVRRTHPQFWHYFHAMTRYMEANEPTQAGVLDMNRYKNL